MDGTSGPLVWLVKCLFDGRGSYHLEAVIYLATIFDFVSSPTRYSCLTFEVVIFDLRTWTPNGDCCTVRIDSNMDCLDVSVHLTEFETCNSALLEQLLVGSMYLTPYIIYVAVA